MQMQREFFDKYKDVYWEIVGDYQLIAPNTVTFHFIRKATDSETGMLVELYGEETIVFNNDGKIVGINVLVLGPYI